MKFWIIKGNVVGGHHIKDIGVRVGYQEEVRVHSDRAAWSSDLAKAISARQVVKERVEEPRRRPQIYQNHPKPKTQRKKAKKKIYKSEVKEYTDTTFAEGTTSVDNLENQSLQNKESEDLKEMVKMNQSLMEKMDVLMGKMSELVEKDSGQSGMDISALAKLLNGKVNGGQGDVTLIQESTEDTPLYIPSNIRSKGTTSKVDVDEGESSGTSLDDAAKILASMKKKS